MTRAEKNEITHDLVERLASEKKIRRIVIFGSFLRSRDPHDLDVAVFQDSREPYLPLAMKYRRCTRNVSRRIPMDIIPVRPHAKRSTFLSEIESGEVVYEK